MAIQLDLSQSQFGVPFTGAYFRVVTAAISRQRGGQKSVMVDVVGYAAKPENDDTREIEFRRYHAPYEDIEKADGQEFFAKCYSWVMTQDDMQGSVGV